MCEEQKRVNRIQSTVDSLITGIIVEQRTLLADTFISVEFALNEVPHRLVPLHTHIPQTAEQRAHRARVLRAVFFGVPKKRRDVVSLHEVLGVPFHATQQAARHELDAHELQSSRRTLQKRQDRRKQIVLEEEELQVRPVALNVGRQKPQHQLGPQNEGRRGSRRDFAQRLREDRRVVLVKERYERGRLLVRSLQRADRAVGAEERRQHRLTTHLDLRHLLSQPLRESTSSHTPFTTSMSAHFTSSGAFIA